jgi:hypothetical protein
MISASAAEHDADPQSVIGTVRRQLAAANFRAEDISFDQLLELLHTALRQMGQ